IHGTVFVDPCRTGLQAGGDLAAGIEVGAPYRGAEPDLEAVGPFDGLLEVRVLDDRQDGAELLLSDVRVAIVDGGDERRGVEEPRPLGYRIAADPPARAPALRGLDAAGDDVVLLLVLQRAEHVPLLEAHSHRGRSGHLAESPADLV